MVSTYAVLDDPAQWAAFSVPDPDSQEADKTQGVWHSQVVVEGMHCGSCALNVEKALRAVPGVIQVTVNGATHRAEVVWRADKGLKRMLLGSETLAVLTHAKTPVLVLR